MLESTVKKHITKFLTQKQAWWYIAVAGTAKKGVPDLIVCYGGYFIGLELKRPKGGKITRVQKQNLHHITEQGGLGICCHSVEFLSELFDAIDQNDDLTKFGYKTHNQTHIDDDLWLEECVW